MSRRAPFTEELPTSNPMEYMPGLMIPLRSVAESLLRRKSRHESKIRSVLRRSKRKRSSVVAPNGYSLLGSRLVLPLSHFPASLPSTGSRSPGFIAGRPEKGERKAVGPRGCSRGGVGFHEQIRYGFCVRQCPFSGYLRHFCALFSPSQITGLG